MNAEQYLIHLGLTEEEAKKMAHAAETANEDELQLMNILMEALLLGEKVAKLRERKKGGEPQENQKQA